MFSILQATGNCSIINSQNILDVKSIRKALDLLKRQTQHKNKCLIIADFSENHKNLYQEINKELKNNNITKIIGIGNFLSKLLVTSNIESHFFSSTDEFIQSNTINQFKDTHILLIALSNYNFEPIIHTLQYKSHITTLSINLEAIKQNLEYFKTYLKPETKIMVMVKAFSYGSGCYEIANFLEYQKVDYLGVAITDEGVSLRKAGITIPIVVMNPEESSFNKLIKHDLEPGIYSFSSLKRFNQRVQKSGMSSYPIHIKIDTGMRRLGFNIGELYILLKYLEESKFLKPYSIFSHMVGSSEPLIHNKFSLKQIEQFNLAYQKIQSLYKHKIIRHILNSGGIENYPKAQYEMVRLGIGLYGISSKQNTKIHNTSILKTKISQIRNVKKNETIGYDRMGIAQKDSRIATIPIGYADGYNRKFSNGLGEVSINGKLAPVIGNICMDMCMIDVSNIEASEGDEVILFGNEIPIAELANKIETIPYEILTSVSERVKRIYYTHE